VRLKSSSPDKETTMSHAPTVDVDYFTAYNADSDLYNRAPIEYIFRQVGDGPLVMWYLNTVGDLVEVTDTIDMPFLDLVWERMRDVEASARVTGSVGSNHVVTFGASPIVIEWYRDQPVAAPDNPANRPVKPFSLRPVETTFLFAPPSSFHGNTVVTATYVPAGYGGLPQHLVIFYTGGVHWTPAEIGGDAPVFGVGRVEYDDVDQKEITTPIGFSHLTYSEALTLHAAELQRALGAPQA
jgi:hypothetical protein